MLEHEWDSMYWYSLAIPIDMLHDQSIPLYLFNTSSVSRAKPVLYSNFCILSDLSYLCIYSMLEVNF